MTRDTERPSLLWLSPDQIYLDPNSPRLIDSPWWEPVPDEEILDPNVQARIIRHLDIDVGHSMTWLVGRPRHGELGDSTTAFGWVDVEPIRVRSLTDDHYVIVDGNRRLALLKEQLRFPTSQRELFPTTAKDAPVQIAAFVVEAADVEMERSRAALRHAYAPKPWSRLATAVWWEGTPDLPLPPPGALAKQSRWIERASRDLKVLEFIRCRYEPHQADVAGTMFEAIADALDRRHVRRWIEAGGWEERVARLRAWLEQYVYETLYGPGFDAGEAPEEPSGLTPRQLDQALAEPSLVEEVEAGADPADLVPFAQGIQSVLPSDSYLHPTLRRSYERAGRAPVALDPTKAQEALRDLRDMLRSGGEQPVEPGHEAPWLTSRSQPLGRHLTSLRIGTYRGLAGVQFDALGRINLFVGANNTGKTSLLEAVHLLAHRSDPRGLLHATSMRMRTDVERDPPRLLELLSSVRVDLGAEDREQDEMGLKLSLDPLPNDPFIDRATQLPKQLRLESTHAGARQVSVTDLFTNRPRSTRVVEGEAQWLEASVLFSPYAGPDPPALMSWYKKAADARQLQGLYDLLREAIQEPITRIELRDEHGRFVVVRSDGGPELDLGNYGDGLRRMFAIGLLFASHARGFVLIDEFESGIHTNALIPFTRYVQQAAEAFDVQVFATTHSKEAVDAFVLNEVSTDDVVAYTLRRSEQGVKTHRYSGRYLVNALEAMDLDIRGR